MLTAVCSRAGFAALSLFACSLSHADVLTVGPGGFASIQAAVDAAQEGDLILVSDTLFSVGETSISGKAVSVFLEGEPRSYVSSTPFGLRVSGLEVGQSVVWRGIGFDQDSGAIVQEPLGFAQCEGTVWMERSANKSVRGTLGVAACDDVVLVEVKCLSPGFEDGNGPASAAVEAQLSELFVFGGEYLGGRGRNAKFGQDGFPNTPSTDGGDGIVLTTSELSTFGALIEGGSGGNAKQSGNICLSASDGGDALVLTDEGCIAFGRANTLVGGVGGADASSSCGGGQDGDPIENPFFAPIVLEPGNPRRLETGDGTFREGEVLGLEVFGSPLELVLLGVAADPDGLLLWPIGALALDPSAKLIPLGILSESGSTSADFPIPELGPGVAWVPRFVQAVHVSPLGFIELGPPSAIALIDSAF